MTAPALSKQSLGTGYVVATGVALSVALLAHAVSMIRLTVTDGVILAVGLTPALTLVAAHYWLPMSGLDGEQIWTAAEWCGCGVALFTVINVVILLSPLPHSSMVPSILASSVAVGGFGGTLVGWLLELRRSRRRLKQSNDVLFRVLRHDLRNDLNVALGHLGELKREHSDRRASVGEPQAHVCKLSESVEALIDTTEKARQIAFAFDADKRARRPVDVVPHVREQVATVERCHPAVSVETDLPDQAPAYADWMLGTVLENVLENAVVHCEETPSLYVSVESRDGRVFVRVSDNCPSIPQHELAVFDSGTETPLHHSKGIGLWLTTWIVESYGGALSLDSSDDGNTVRLELRGPTRLDRLWEWLQSRL
ncbi:ATP-binding protein [Haloarcula salina]|uniref:histidine kinase n=1 Tax=Haloarcula salina TaxID=1429914 RepID=A0AA41FZD1_9EURY|nr:ATP-binding protein [Haloarcula salina]MBV0901565.1 GHKL domain-containing protein [Haloarcula salina]